MRVSQAQGPTITAKGRNGIASQFVRQDFSCNIGCEEQ